MAREKERKRKVTPERPKLTAREILELILRTYGASLPYILIFVAVMLVATWVVTTLIFR